MDIGLEPVLVAEVVVEVQTVPSVVEGGRFGVVVVAETKVHRNTPHFDRKRKMTEAEAEGSQTVVEEEGRVGLDGSQMQSRTPFAEEW